MTFNYNGWLSILASKLQVGEKKTCRYLCQFQVNAMCQIPVDNVEGRSLNVMFGSHTFEQNSLNVNDNETPFPPQCVLVIKMSGTKFL